MKLISGYISDTRVKLGLSICTGPGTISCPRCPYNSRGCVFGLNRDALSYIVLLERKVMEYEEKENQP